VWFLNVFGIAMKDEKLENRVKGCWEECTSLEELPPAQPNPDGLDYIVEIKRGKLPLRRLRNVVYFLFPIVNNPEKAIQKREQLILRYGLQNEDVIIYAKGNGGLAKP